MRVLAAFLSLVLTLSLSADEVAGRQASGGSPKKTQVGDVIVEADAGYQVTITTPGWRQVAPGRKSSESELEFSSRNRDDWAIVFLIDDNDLPGRSSFRVDWIRGLHSDVRCRDRRTLSEDGGHIVGTLDCKGYSFLDGHYRYLSRVVSDGQRSVELIIHVTDTSQHAFRRRAGLFDLADGLDLL